MTMATGGWIKLHRSITEWEWYRNGNTARLFLHLLLTAAHEKTIWHGVEIQPGDVVTTGRTVAEYLGISEFTVRKSLAYLTETMEISHVLTFNPFGSIWKINNWNQYQCDAVNIAVNNAVSNAVKNDFNKLNFNDLSNDINNSSRSKQRSKNEENERTPFHIEEDIKKDSLSITPAHTRTHEGIQAGFIPWPSSPSEVLTEATRAGMFWTPDMAERFFNYYSAVGWTIKAGPIRNWHFMLKGWYDNERQFRSNNNVTGQFGGGTGYQQPNNGPDRTRKGI